MILHLEELHVERGGAALVLVDKAVDMIHGNLVTSDGHQCDRDRDVGVVADKGLAWEMISKKLVHEEYFSLNTNLGILLVLLVVVKVPVKVPREHVGLNGG